MFIKTKTVKVWNLIIIMFFSSQTILTREDLYKI